MDNLEYIKKFSKIAISKLCKKNNIDHANLITGRCAEEKEKIIREDIESEIAKLYLKEDQNG